MFPQIISILIGILLISLALINLSSNVNPSLHLFMDELFKQIHENVPIDYLRQISLNKVKTIFSIFLLISGCVLHFCSGIKRLIFLIPLSIISIYVVESAIIYSFTLHSVAIYIFLLMSILIVLFNDCAQLDELEI
ncbi:unnamed protein product [Rotaria magnacalcarata]|uniref:Uncharacterized protein n=1 Tax=Rotaria magnacalcarata TaxID=392030 RepID=A0A816BLV5_9BILA|nr:unnamed protein product [Rotaria magnacalcarata]CAF1609972.1 unnamed protein product [Rotaria magnacalcarata]CAF1975939.1 unnamed protein product [Rotaria magnacalcarata]CAF2061509.1 unnamed protein product [Rotaria magnacalcarata]CAF2136491.1 unnamed protein product [Rotaria magnacalcarata]